MNENCKRDNRNSESNCSQTRKQVAKIMAAFGLIIIFMAGYIIKEGILEKLFI